MEYPDADTESPLPRPRNGKGRGLGCGIVSKVTVRTKEMMPSGKSRKRYASAFH